MANEQELLQLRIYRFKIEQTSKGARVTIHGNDLEETLKDYTFLRRRLKEEGFKIAPEE